MPIISGWYSKLVLSFEDISPKPRPSLSEDNISKNCMPYHGVVAGDTKYKGETNNPLNVWVEKHRKSVARGKALK